MAFFRQCRSASSQLAMHEMPLESKVGMKLIRAKCHYSAVISVQTDRRQEYSSSCSVAPMRTRPAAAPRHRILPAVVGFRCRRPRSAGLAIDRRSSDGGFVTVRCAAALSDSRPDVGPDFSLYDTKRILTYQKVDSTSKRRR